MAAMEDMEKRDISLKRVRDFGIIAYIAVALCAVGLSAQAVEPVSYLDWDDANKKMTNAMCTVYETYTNQEELAAGKTYVVQGDVSRKQCITVLGTVTEPTYLILCDGVKLTVLGGVEVNSGSALIICGQTEGTGELEAKASRNSDAGIGGAGSAKNGGTITINGGRVKATGGMQAAGIGGGDAYWENSGGGFDKITINGGVVWATGGSFAAGIGGGSDNVDGGAIVINGGDVTAAGGSEGIGRGDSGKGDCTVTFGEGQTFVVLAGEDAAGATNVTQAAFAADHSAKYVALKQGCALKIPAGVHYTYVVSNETSGVELLATLATGTNTYGVVTGTTVKVYFTLDEGSEWTGNVTNPMAIENIKADTVVDAAELPTASGGELDIPDIQSIDLTKLSTAHKLAVLVKTTASGTPDASVINLKYSSDLSSWKTLPADEKTANPDGTVLIEITVPEGPSGFLKVELAD